MSAPRTSLGKPCKKCLKKGSPCHLHKSVSSSPKKLSPNTKAGSFDSALGTYKSPLKRKLSTPKELPQFEYLPLPALQEILLNIPNRDQLTYICNNSRQAAKVCKTPEFKKLYNSRHSLKGYYAHIKKVFLQVFDIKFIESREDMDLVPATRAQINKFLRKNKRKIDGAVRDFFIMLQREAAGDPELLDNLVKDFDLTNESIHDVRNFLFARVSPDTLDLSAEASPGKRYSASPVKTKSASPAKTLKLTPTKRREMERKWDKEHGGRWWSEITHYPF